MNTTEPTPKRPDLTLDEALAQETQKLRIGTARFKFNIKPNDAYRLLMSCFANEVRDRHAEPNFTDLTLDKLWKLALLLTQDSPKFGVMLCGSVGNGKTTMLKALQRAIIFLNERGYFRDEDGNKQRRRLNIVVPKEIIWLAKDDRQQYEEIKDSTLLGVDDLGEEARELNNYGNIVTPIVDLIEHRYDKQLFTVFTTNLAPNEIEDAYGPRVADRLREMVTIINFGNEKSYRR